MPRRAAAAPAAPTAPTAPAAPAARSAAAPDPGPAAPAARPPRRSQAERRGEAEQRLLDAAMRIVAQRGSLRMTLAEVGEAAGYSRGLPAHRFGSKGGLVRALAAHIGARFAARRGAQPASAPGLAAIAANIRLYFGRQGEDWLPTRALLVLLTEAWMVPEPAEGLRAELAAYNRGALAWFEDQVRAGIAGGEIAPDNDPAVTAVIVLGALRGIVLQWLVDERLPLAAVRDRMLRLVEQMLRAPARALPPAPADPAPSDTPPPTPPAHRRRRPA